MKLNAIKKLCSVMAASILFFSTAANACTGIYVGKNVSADGSVILARTEDMTSYNSKRFIVVPAADHKSGENFKDAHGLTFPYPSHTYRYSAVPGSQKRGIGDAPFSAAGFNELGVAATSTITAYPNSKAIAADPYTKNGLYELSANSVILQSATSARHGIEIVADIVDKYGSGEGNIIMTADKDEAWYMEIYTGHQYAAIKLPDDMAAVIPNAFMLGEIDLDSPDVIVSDELVSLAEKKGFLKKTNGTINLRETYAESKKDSNSIRIWGGQRLLHGDVKSDPYKTDYTLLFKPSKKITVEEVMDTTRTRYEGTKYFIDNPGNQYVRSISTSRQEECHILQIRPDLPQSASCLMWLCYSNSEFAPYLPYYASAMTDTPQVAKYDSQDYTEYSMYWAARSLNTLCSQNRLLYGNNVKRFYDTYEKNLIEYVKETDEIMANSDAPSQTANELAEHITYDAYGKSRTIFSGLIEFLAAYEGESESPGNNLTFEIKIAPTVDKVVSYSTSAPTVITE